MKKLNRPGFTGSTVFSGEAEQAKQDLANYLRSRGETKTMLSSNDPSGGWTVHSALADGIGSLVRDNSAVRQLLNFLPIESGDNFEESRYFCESLFWASNPSKQQKLNATAQCLRPPAVLLPSFYSQPGV